MNVYSLVDSLFVANLVSTEVLALAVSVSFFKTKKEVYHYA